MPGMTADAGARLIDFDGDLRERVAEGLGATVLPDFSVVGDPLERRGVLVHRPIADDTTRVLLMLQRRRADSVPRAARDLHEAFVRRARQLVARAGS